MATTAELIRQCTTCHSLESEADSRLLHCAKCPQTLYCSQKCQKADWKSHKVTCAGRPQPKPKLGSTPSPAAASRPHNPGFHAINGMLGLSNDDYLHSMPEKEVFAQLIDCFRMRVDDEYTWGGHTVGIYKEDDPRPDFKEFLDLAEGKKGILPEWWSKEKRGACERMSVDAQGWNNINFAVEKADIIEHYGNSLMPMTLRVLGEKIYGGGFM